MYMVHLQFVAQISSCSFGDIASSLMDSVSMLKQQGYESAVSCSSDETCATIEMAGDMGRGETHEAQYEAQDPNTCTKASQGLISTVGGVQVWKPDAKKPQEDL